MNSRSVPLKPPSKRRHIAMKAVESSAVKAIGHDPKSRTLRVEFHSGGVYDYPDISVEEHQAILDAQSIGRHLTKHIRHRNFTKLPEAA